MKIQGINVKNITHKDPGNNLPKWVRQQAEKRGYGDSAVPLSLYIQDGDITEAFACAAQGNGADCVMAQAGKRIGAKSVYFYRTTAWVDFGTGPIVRFATTRQIYHNVIEPFDRGDRGDIVPGIYHLTPPTRSKTLEGRRQDTEKYPRSKYTNVKNSDGSKSAIATAHTERVVMAAQVKK